MICDNGQVNTFTIQGMYIATYSTLYYNSTNVKHMSIVQYTLDNTCTKIPPLYIDHNLIYMYM